MLSILYISECSTEENYDEDVEEAGGVAQVGDIQLPPGIPQANVSAGYITAREEARRGREQIELGKSNKQKKKDAVEDAMLKFLAKDPMADASEIDLAFAAHSKRIKKFLDVNQTEDLMEEIQHLVNDAIRRVRAPPRAPPRVPTSTAVNPAYQEGQHTSTEGGDGPGMMQLLSQPEMPPMHGPSAERRVPYSHW